jgi:hypothetical protein
MILTKIKVAWQFHIKFPSSIKFYEDLSCSCRIVVWAQMDGGGIIFE